MEVVFRIQFFSDMEFIWVLDRGGLKFDLGFSEFIQDFSWGMGYRREGLEGRGLVVRRFL